MTLRPEFSQQTVHDRALMLHGPKRNEVLTLEEVQRYGSDSFADPDYVRLYGMTPAQWYARGVRLLGRTALDEDKGLDLRRTEPPITEIVAHVAETCPDQKLMFAIQVYEKLEPDSLNELKAQLDWSHLKIYDLNIAGRNHGILLGGNGWTP